MSGPRYGGRGHSKCMIRNESLIDEGRNRFKRAPHRPQHARAGPVRLAPRLGAAIGAWAASAQSAKASGLMSRSSWASARRRSRCRNATLAAGPRPRTARGTGWRAPRSRESPFKLRARAEMQLQLRLSGWRICAHCETISGPRRRRWRPRRPSTDNDQRRTGGLPHACGGRLSGCGPASAVCCTLVVAPTLLGRWQVGAEAACG